jgi:hypothetical protein
MRLFVQTYEVHVTLHKINVRYLMLRQATPAERMFALPYLGIKYDTALMGAYLIDFLRYDR